MISILEQIYQKLNELLADKVITKEERAALEDKIKRIFTFNGITINGNLTSYLTDQVGLHRTEKGKVLKLHLKQDKTELGGKYIVLSICANYIKDDIHVAYSNKNRIRYNMYNFHSNKVLAEVLTGLLR